MMNVTGTSSLFPSLTNLLACALCQGLSDFLCLSALVFHPWYMCASLIYSRCWLTVPCSWVLIPVLSCALLCSQRVNGAVCEYGLPAGLSAGAGEAVWDAQPSSGGGAEVLCRHPAPPPPQHAGKTKQTPAPTQPNHRDHLPLQPVSTLSIDSVLDSSLIRAPKVILTSIPYVLPDFIKASNSSTSWKCCFGNRNSKLFLQKSRSETFPRSWFPPHRFW